jgi:hypothetical protein
MLIERPKYYIGKSGKKYPFGNPNFYHKANIEVYCNFGKTGTKNIKDLPKEDYPYLIEYGHPLKVTIKS